MSNEALNTPSQPVDPEVKALQEELSYMKRDLDEGRTKTKKQIEYEEDASWKEHNLSEHESQLEGRLTEAHFKARAQRNHEVQLETQIHIDKKTGLANQEGFMEWLEGELRAKPENLWVAYIDLDNFKDINDRFGHSKGDDILRWVAKLLSTSIREVQDIAARPHGDEFVLGIDGADSHRIEVLAEDILRTLNSIGISETGALVPVIGTGNKNTITIRLSMGFARWQQGETADQLLHRADQAMFLAKRSGRNRYEIANTESSNEE